MEDTSIGLRIKQRRKELGLTQLQIKQDAGISSGNMSDIENGNKLPSASALIMLSKVLDCSIDWILTGAIPKKNNNNILDTEDELLNGFRSLSKDEQEELLEILRMKLRKVKRELNVRSSDLTESKGNNMVG